MTERQAEAIWHGIVVGLLLLIAVFTAGCESQTAPTSLATTKPSTPKADGRYLCQTKPRQYCASDLSACWFEVDTYSQDTPCPAEPID